MSTFWADAQRFLPILLQGMGMTILVTLWALVLATTLGIAWALMRTSGIAWLEWPARAFTNVIRGIPILVQLFYIYFVLPELGIVTGHDPRFLQTLDAVTNDLKRGDWLFRYRHRDDFGTPATAFTICAFWYVNALAAAGQRDEARELFQRLLERRTSLGLLAEDIDPASGELWGNFPQTYSMVGIINCAVRLSRPWEDVL